SPVQVGTSWHSFAARLAPGDLDGDGANDVLGIYPDPGDVYLYPGNGGGGWKPRELVDTSWHTYVMVIAPGDFDGDGHVDVMGVTASGDLWLHSGDGGGGWSAGQLVGTGWNG